MAEDAAKTDIKEQKEQSSEEKRKKNWDGESALSTTRNGHEALRVAETFSCGGSFRYHIEKDHLKSPRFRLHE